MCGRFAQYQGMADYLRELNSEQDVISGYDNVPIERYNVAPSTKVQLLHAEEDGIVIAAARWGWEPQWAAGKMPPPINARVEKVASGKFFRQIWPHRALVPADGWYEWVTDEADPKRKQPYFIRLRAEAPLFFAAIGQYPSANELPCSSDGFVIITADAEGSMVDIHSRRPVVLAPEQARQWIDPNFSTLHAEQFLRQHGRPADDFEWFKVDKAVGNSRNDSPSLICPTPNAQSLP